MKKIIVLSIVFMFLFASLSFGMDCADKTKKECAKVAKADKKGCKCPTVYVTEKGKKYHKKNCKLVKTGKKGISACVAIKKGLKPCAVCKPVEKADCKGESKKKSAKKTCTKKK